MSISSPLATISSPLTTSGENKYLTGENKFLNSGSNSGPVKWNSRLMRINEFLNNARKGVS